jgi:hypothetical protein
MSDKFRAAMDVLLGEAVTREDALRASELIAEASEEGDPDASERCALFEAFGMARPQSWARAFDYLALAAAQGSRTAQEQLLLLSDNGADPAVPADAPAEAWSEVRRSIEFQRLITPGERRRLSESPRVRVIERFATPAECRWLIRLAQDRLRPATVFDRQSGELRLDPGRDNHYLMLRLGEMNVLTEVIRNRIAAATGLPVPLFEPSQLLHYDVGQSFDAHHDFLDPGNEAYHADLARFGQRIATFLIYLNEDYSGGETSFPAIDLRFRGRTGDALFFANITRDGRPDPRTLHAGLPPSSGEKWVFSQWIRSQLPGP